MILAAQQIRELRLVTPFFNRAIYKGMSYGLSPAGYDLRVRGRKGGTSPIHLAPGEFTLVTTIERVQLPTDIMGQIVDKSTWARKGLSLFNTVFDPGWEGYPTLELANLGPKALSIGHGMPIAQMIFMFLSVDTTQPYKGKYQNQEQEPVEARLEV